MYSIGYRIRVNPYRMICFRGRLVPAESIFMVRRSANSSKRCRGIEAVARIASIGGTAGQDLLQRGTALDAVSRILPSVLVNAASIPQVTMTQLPR